MGTMVRKQIYVRRDQDDRLKREARATGVSEAEIVRRAIDARLRVMYPQGGMDDEAWEAVLRFLSSMDERPSKDVEPITWNRDALYADR